MISTRTYPKTKSELIQAIQKTNLDKFAIIEPYADKKSLDISCATISETKAM